MLSGKCFGTDTASLTWSTWLWAFEKNGIKKTFKEFAGLQSLSCSHSSEDTVVHIFIKPRLEAFISSFHQTNFWWPSREVLPIYHQMHQPKLHISSQCKSNLLPLYTAFGYYPSPNIGGQKSSRDLSLASGGRFVNTHTQRESFGAQLLAAGCVFRSDWSLIEDRATLWQGNFTCQNLLPHSKSCKGWRPQPRRALSSQSKVKVMFHHGRGAVTILQAPDLMVPDFTPLQNKNTFIKVASMLLETTLDSF